MEEKALRLGPKKSKIKLLKSKAKHSVLIILLGFRYLASSIPLIVFAGVGVGVGLILAMLLNSMARNPLISNNLVR